MMISVGPVFSPVQTLRAEVSVAPPAELVLGVPAAVTPVMEKSSVQTERSV